MSIELCGSCCMHTDWTLYCEPTNLRNTVASTSDWTLNVTWNFILESRIMKDTFLEQLRRIINGSELYMTFILDSRINMDYKSSLTKSDSNERCVGWLWQITFELTVILDSRITSLNFVHSKVFQCWYSSKWNINGIDKITIFILESRISLIIQSCSSIRYLEVYCYVWVW